VIPSAALSVYTNEVESANLLREALNASSVPHFLLGATTESPRQFFCFDIESEGTLIAKVGALSAGIGVKPGFLVVDGHVFFGYNTRVAVLGVTPPQLRQEIDLLSLFWTFFDPGELGHFCVICETALVALSPEGDVRWRVDTDLIVDFAVNEAVASLRLADAPPMRIDLRNGSVLGR
jgi:hypothetical protein